MSGDNLTQLLNSIISDDGLLVNTTNYWTGTIHLAGVAPATAANYNTALIFPFTSGVIEGIYCVFSGTGGTSAAVMVERIQAAEANDAGDDLLTAAFDLTATANTVQTGALVTGAALNLVLGDRLGLVDSGTLTGADDLVITVKVRVTEI